MIVYVRIYDRILHDSWYTNNPSTCMYMHVHALPRYMLRYPQGTFYLININHSLAIRFESRDDVIATVIDREIF